ncbi:MAG: hypothetical protein RIS44_888 [Pseudomonadota bacterium]|jgi:hypothetical protein
MLYKFKSQATSDLIMLGPQGDQLLKLLGRSPAAQGIIEPETMPQAWALLERAVMDEEAARGDNQRENKPNTPQEEAEAEEAPAAASVGLRQRVWPFVEMLRRAHAEKQPVVWGV